jgi:hypothetical protein
MTLIQRLARCAKRVLRFPASKSTQTDIADQKRRAKAQLRSRVTAHILKDIGIDDS